jgi:hypothetical protein
MSRDAVLCSASSVLAVHTDTIDGEIEIEMER